MGFVIFLHCSVAILLMITILMQAGKGGGLTEQFASAESIFGARTNVFMVKATAILGSLFILTSVTLAVFSSKQNQSLMNARAAAKKTPAATGTAIPQGAAATSAATPSASAAVVDQKTEVVPPAVDGDAQKPQ
jgi:preprotein translocase subunit SecG